MLSACSGFEIKSLGQALYEQNAVIAVVEAGGRNGRFTAASFAAACSMTALGHSQCQHQAGYIIQLDPVGARIASSEKKTMTASLFWLIWQ